MTHLWFTPQFFVRRDESFVMKCIIRSSISLRVNDNLLTDHNDIVDHVVTHFTNHNSTSILQDNNLIAYVIPNSSLET